MPHSVKVLKAFRAVGTLLDQLGDIGKDFKADGIRTLLESTPPLEQLVKGVEETFDATEGGEFARRLGSRRLLYAAQAISCRMRAPMKSTMWVPPHRFTEQRR